jgi:hypothetical protein
MRMNHSRCCHKLGFCTVQLSAKTRCLGLITAHKRGELKAPPKKEEKSSFRQRVVGGLVDVIV